MLELREIQLSDKPWIDQLLAISDFMSCEYTFANNAAWRRLMNTKITRYKDFYISCNYCEDGSPCFTYPAGDGDVEEMISVLSEYSATFHRPLRFSTASAESLAILRSIYGSKIHAVPLRDSFDYIYRTDELIPMAGKKFHAKRNHIANFKKKEWHYEKMTHAHFPACIEFAVNSYERANGYDDFSSVVEQYAINTFFNYFDQMGLCGGVLYQEDRMVGFTIGEGINSNTFAIHIEKAEHGVQGAYPTLFHEFIKAEAQDYMYINREEDLGIEGLRRSKMSYNPTSLYEKYRVDFPVKL